MAMALLRGKSNYAYAVTRVMARRAKLIPKTEYQKILKMDISEITRFIQESAYKTEVDELANRFAGLDLLEAALSVNEERSYQSIRQMVQGSGGALLTLYLDRFQVEDLKTIIRGKRAGATQEELLGELLLEDSAMFEMWRPVMQDDIQTLDQIAEALQRAGGIGGELARVLRGIPVDTRPSEVEDLLDKWYFDRLLTALGESKEKGAGEMRDFVRQEVDAINILNAARWVAAGQKDDFSSFVVPGGRVFSVGEIVQLATSNDLAAFGEQLKDHAIYDKVAEALQHASETGRLSAFQAAVRSWHMAMLDKLSGSNPLSLLPILLYILMKRREVVTLRALARGKAAGLPESRLEELAL